MISQARYLGLGTQAHFSKNGPGERQNWKNQHRNGRGVAGRTAVTDKTLSPVTGDSGSEPISVLSRPVGKHSLRDLRSCPWQLSPSPQLLPPGPVKAGHGVRRSVSPQAHLYPPQAQLLLGKILGLGHSPRPHPKIGPLSWNEFTHSVMNFFITTVIKFITDNLVSFRS